MKKPGVAIVGIGRWGKNLLRELSALADVRATVTRSSEQTLVGTLADPSVEAVVIATPIATHAGIARQALEAGKHVFLEKPGTPNAAELEALLELAEQRGQVLQVGYVFLHHPAFAALELIHRDDPVTALSMSWEKLGSFGEPLGLNLLTHELSIAISLLGVPDACKLTAATGIMTECDTADVLLSWQSASATVRINRASPTKKKTTSVRTRSGRWLVWENDSLSELDRAAGTFTPLPLEPGTALAAECRSFLARCAQGHINRDELPLQVHRTLALLNL